MSDAESAANKSMVDSSPFLSTRDFEAGLFPMADFELPCSGLTIDGRDPIQVRLKARYERHTELYLSHDAPTDPLSLLNGTSSWSVSGPEFPEPVKLIPVSLNLQVARLWPSIQPLLWRRSNDACSVSAVLVNGPSLEYSNHSLKFSADEFDIELTEFASVQELRKASRLYKDDKIATASITLTSRDGKVISAEAALSKLSRLVRFLTFLRGGRCAIGNILGLGQNGSLAFAYLGFGKADGFLTEPNWCDQQVVCWAPDIFALYAAAEAEPENTKILLRSVDYYRAANVGRAASPQMALVASYAALETLVPHILSSKAGWSNNRLGTNTPFADKIRAAAAFIGLSAPLLEHAPALSKRLSANTKHDGYDMLALIRNRITHHKVNFSYSAYDVLEAWHLSQWLCELLIFYLIGYRGLMNDQRRHSGWRGPAVAVPLA